MKGWKGCPCMTMGGLGTAGREEMRDWVEPTRLEVSSMEGWEEPSPIESIGEGCSCWGRTWGKYWQLRHSVNMQMVRDVIPLTRNESSLAEN